MDMRIVRVPLDVVEARGSDRRALLQRLTTNDVLPNGVVGNLFTDENGRILHAVTMILTDERDLIVGEVGMAAPLMAWLDKMTFREDATFRKSETPLVPIVGETRGHSLTELGVSIAYVIGNADGPEMTRDAWHALRVESGLARADRTVCEGHNPHEARFADRLNDRKGCYIGQEVVARLDTYDKVQRLLVRLALSAPGSVGAEVKFENEVAGTLAAVAEKSALAYVKKAFAEKPAFSVGGAEARALPWPL